MRTFKCVAAEMLALFLLLTGIAGALEEKPGSAEQSRSVDVLILSGT
jgi:hypothetical protein